MIPKTGGNRYSGSLFATAVNSSFQGSNNDDELVARGLRTPNSLKHPVRHQSRASAARLEARQAVVLHLGPVHAAGELRRRPVPEQERRRHHQVGLRAGPEQARLLQRHRGERQPAPDLAGQRQANKFNFFYDQHWRCQCARRPARPSRRRRPTTSSTRSAICVGGLHGHADRTAAGRGARRRPARGVRLHAEQPATIPQRLLIPVIEQGGLIPGPAVSGRRDLQSATQPYQRTLGVSIPFGRVAVLRHRQPLGQVRLLQRHRAADVERARQRVASDLPVQQRRAESADPARDAAVPGRAAAAGSRHLRAGQVDAQPADAQRRRAVRHFSSYFPEQTLEPGPLVPTRNMTFPKTDMANWNDIVPRLGSAYDLFGNGKTARQGVAEQVRDRAGAAGHVRRHRESGQPPGQHRHPHAGPTRTATSCPTAT